ncbi:hypothetical protein CLV33_101676 [Jejuia pallidilutea]|uniref:Lipocalin-like protein n=1 Tax=Jejuia pallidilutea TaxID=504487 RepID=A0A362X7R6_9FLAO|nr:fibronectin type III domain-containing protein [Jejuia pallidilutea]PQV51746.1 hypothetical protein CLV33_101676 [Jejuia pallidilutea]
MNYKFQLIVFSIFSLSLLMLSCESDDINERDSIKKDVKKEDLYGIWSIYNVELNNQIQNVPVNFEECGRDFFIYQENGLYEEFLFQESRNCIPTKNILNWELDNGILRLSTTNQTETIEVNNVNNTTFVFSANLDLDGDGKSEKYKFTALRYIPPNEMDIYSSSFSAKHFTDRIEFNWDEYIGYNNFLKYEIYRSTANCDIDSADLIGSIEDVKNTKFIDENAPNAESLCYFLKIYTNKGLLGQSDARYIYTENIIPKNVTIKDASSAENSVTISWQKYEGYHFSHYEIRVQDQNENSSPNIETVKIIDDINITSYTDEMPPYVNHPVYSIYVHNIFGNISPLERDKNMIETNFTRSELLEFDYIRFLNFDPAGKVFYFYGVNPDNSRRLIKYDYINKTVEAEGFKLPTVQTDVEMQLVNSENGEELIFEQGGDYWVYDTTDLTFKYALKPGFGLRDSFAYLKNNIWIFSDKDDVFTFKRNGDEMLQIDEKPHFPDHQGGMNYEITKLDDTNILLSHNNEGRAIHFSVDNEGYITQKGIIEIPLWATYNSDISVNSTASLILNKKRNKVYSSTDFSEVASYTNPLTTSSINTSGTKIFGTDKEEVSARIFQGHKKEIVVYDLVQNSIINIGTKGYPLYVVEDNDGNIISLSSGFPRDEYYDIHNHNMPDMFVEIIE